MSPLDTVSDVTSGTLTVPNKLLAPALARARSVVGTQQTVPILTCVLLIGNSGTLTVESNNTELSIREVIPLATDGSISAAIDADIASSFLQRLPEDAQVTIERAGEATTIKAGRSRVSLPSLPPDTFPAFRSVDLPVNFAMPCRGLLSILSRARPFVGEDQTRPWLCGIHLSAPVRDGERVFMASSTNGNQFGRAYTTLPNGAAHMAPVLLPAKTAAELCRLLETDDEVRISASENTVVFRVGLVTMTSKLLESGSYPDLDRALPRGNTNSLRIGKNDMIRSLNLVTSVCRTDRQQTVKLDLAPIRAAFASATSSPPLTSPKHPQITFGRPCSPTANGWW